MKRKTYMRIQSGSKALLIIILVIAILVGGVVGTFYAIHDSRTTEELATLQDSGLVNFVKLSDEQQMNVAVRGATSAKHTLVTIAGLGYQDFGVYMDYITTPLQEENRLVIIDRLGTGFSDDIGKDTKRTASAIVEEYRKALQKSLIDGPYVLLAHEIGAAYATLWQATYPDEVEGIIYIDPNPMDKSYAGLKLHDKASLISFGSQFGVQRILYNDLYTPEAVRIPSSYVSAATYFNFHSVYTKGYLAEVENAMKNMSAAFDSVQATNIPKMYINSSYAFETKEEALEYVDYMNAQARSVGQEKVYGNTEGAAEKLISNSQSMTEQIKTYVQKLGNCHLVKMPGGASVYEQHHGVLEAAIIDFIDYLDGETSTLKDRYTDRVLEEWQQNQEELTAQEEVTEPPVETETES